MRPFVSALILLAACARPAPVESLPMSASQQLDALFDAAWEARLADDPSLAAYEGRETRQHEWPPYTLAFQEQIVAREASFLERVQAIDPAGLTDQERLSVRLYADEVAERREALRWWRHGYPVDQMNGMHAWPATFLIDIHAVHDAGDAEAYVGRLRGLGPLLDEVVAEMRARHDLGVAPPKFVYAYVIDDCRNLTTGAPFDDGPDSPLMADFRAKVAALDADEATKARLLALAEAALRDVVGPAYGRLVDEARRQEAVATTDDGAWKLPDAEAYYAFRLRQITTTRLDAEAIHALGLAEVTRIHGEMEALRGQIGFEGDLRAFFEHLRTHPDFFYEESHAGREAYLARATAVIDDMRERLPALFSTLPKNDLVVKAVEPYREKSAGKAFYTEGAPDGSRPGIYYANLHKMSAMPTYQLRALAYHEGIPGHHLQLSIARELPGLPEVRTRADRTAYIEGWGLYSERFPAEMGLYEDPYEDFGRLAMELWRACRLVVDTGIHHRQWTREQAIEYLVTNTPNPRSDAVKAIERYIVMPGQATAYSVGMLRILELRERARAELGDDFDLRAFHDVVLTNGPVPLDVLGEIVDAWIAAEKGA